MSPPSLKFAVVREDPDVEAACITRVGARRALVCASGGCTAFALAHRFEGLDVHVYDANPLQLAHVERKAEAIAHGALAQLNVGDAAPSGLSQRGEFEALFRLLRAAVVEFVAPSDELERYFAAGTTGEDAPALARRWTGSRYWRAVFAAVFTEELLVAMFGPNAVQHAERGSYPAWFAGVFARGLLRADGPRNPFVQHVLLGRYLEADAPAFLSARRRLGVHPHLGGVPDVPDLARFDLVHLSNIFDWSDDALVEAWAGALRALKPGAVITIRQLNNARDVRRFLEPAFAFDDAFAAPLLAADRSLFYGRLHVGVRAP